MYIIRTYGDDGQGSVSGMRTREQALYWYNEMVRQHPDRVIILKKGDIIIPIADL